MARIRYLKPDFFVDPDLCELSFQHRLIFSGLWCHADKSGRLKYEPRKLKVQIVPYDNVKMDKILMDLTKKPFIQIYEVEGVAYIQIKNWDKHQKPHNTEKESTIPPFNGEITVKEHVSNVGHTISSHISSHISSNSKIDKDKILYLSSVYLTKEQYDKLITRFGIEGTAKRIYDLNNGIMSKGYKYKSHYHTILSWESKNGNSNT